MSAPRVFITAACPHLPHASEAMDYRMLEKFGARRDGEFFYAALCYGQHLWRCGHAGRALLALTRALYAEVQGNEEALQDFPLPYRAIGWIVEHHSTDDFPGNPRLSYQHQALRICGDRKEIRQARAWAAWAMVCQIRPHLPGDPLLPEISLEEISAALATYGIAGEQDCWASSIAECRMREDDGRLKFPRDSGLQSKAESA